MGTAMSTLSAAKIKLFEKSEYQERIGLVKQRMLVDGIDLLLIASPSNQFWTTGYDGWSFYTPQIVIIQLDHAEPIWFGRRMDAIGAKLTVFMPDENVVEYGDEFVSSSERHPMQALASLIKERGWDKGTIGVEMDDYYYTARWHSHLTYQLAKAEFKDAFLLVNRCRMKKSEQELVYMRQAAQIGAKSIEAAVDACAEGRRQCDVMAALYGITIGGTAEIGGTFPCKPPNAVAGPLAIAPHLSWTDAPLKENEIFFIEQAGVRHRYHAPLSRCIYLGSAPKKMHDSTKIIAEGVEAVLQAARPGQTCEGLAAEWKRVTAKHGIERDARIGYPVGIGYPPTWGELTCSLRKGDETTLELGMTFHCVPAISFDGYQLVVSETFEVTHDGGRPLANFPRTLLEKRI
jgi:ectoine hydrolase